MATLIVTQGPAAGQRFRLEQHRLVMIGRDASCTIQIVDAQLSRHHLQIERVEDEDRHYAIDFQSKNGVLVNGAKIEGRTPLRDCDVIEIGETTLVYAVSDEEASLHVHDAAKRFGQGHLRTFTDDGPGRQA